MLPIWLAMVLLAAPPRVGRPTPTPTRPAGPLVIVDRIEVVVGDDVLLKSDIDRLVAVRFLPRRPGEPEEAYRDRTREARIVDLLRERELRRTGAPEPETKAVEARLADLRARAVAEGSSFEEALARAGMTPEEVVTLVRRGLALETFVRERIGASVRVTEADLEALYAGEAFREEAVRRGIPLVPFASLPPDVKDQLRSLVTERKLTEAVERWTAELRQRTRVVVYRPAAATEEPTPRAPGGAGGGAPPPAAESR